MPERLSRAHLWSGLARPDQGLNGVMEILSVGRVPLIQYDEVHRQGLHAPVLEGLKRFFHQGKMITFRHPHQQDRQIA